MTPNKLKQKVSAEYDRRNLKSRVRYHALDKVIAFLGKNIRMQQQTSIAHCPKINLR